MSTFLLSREQASPNPLICLKVDSSILNQHFAAASYAMQLLMQLQKDQMKALLASNYVNKNSVVVHFNMRICLY